MISPPWTIQTGGLPAFRVADQGSLLGVSFNKQNEHEGKQRQGLGHCTTSLLNLKDLNFVRDLRCVFQRG